jgi:hypothetical protein
MSDWTSASASAAATSAVSESQSLSLSQPVSESISVSVSKEITETVVEMMKGMIRQNTQTILSLANGLTNKTRAEVIAKVLPSVRTFTGLIEEMNSAHYDNNDAYLSLCRNELTGELLAVLNVALCAPHSDSTSPALSGEKQHVQENKEIYLDDLSAFGLILFKHYLSSLLAEQVDDYLFVLHAMASTVQQRASNRDASKESNSSTLLMKDSDSFFLKLVADTFIAFYPRMIQIAEGKGSALSATWLAAEGDSPMMMTPMTPADSAKEGSDATTVEYEKAWWSKQFDLCDMLHKLLKCFSSRVECNWARTNVEGILQSQKKVKEILKLRREGLYAMLTGITPGSASASSGNKGQGEDASLNVCLICMDEPRTIICLPCMHMCYCESCVDQFDALQTSDCPRCRGKVDKLSKVFN